MKKVEYVVIYVLSNANMFLHQCSLCFSHCWSSFVLVLATIMTVSIVSSHWFPGVGRVQSYIQVY